MCVSMRESETVMTGIFCNGVSKQNKQAGSGAPNLFDRKSCGREKGDRWCEERPYTIKNKKGENKVWYQCV